MAGQLNSGILFMWEQQLQHFDSFITIATSLQRSKNGLTVILSSIHQSQGAWETPGNIYPLLNLGLLLKTSAYLYIHNL